MEEEEGGEEHIEELKTDSIAHGWYVQGVYKPAPSWRIGARYARTTPGSTTTPMPSRRWSNWSDSEFGRVRPQYNHEAIDGHEEDNQIILQYVMSLGAHASHGF